MCRLNAQTVRRCLTIGVRRRRTATHTTRQRARGLTRMSQAPASCQFALHSVENHCQGSSQRALVLQEGTRLLQVRVDTCCLRNIAHSLAVGGVLPKMHIHAHTHTYTLQQQLQKAHEETPTRSEARCKGERTKSLRQRGCYAAHQLFLNPCCFGNNQRPRRKTILSSCSFRRPTFATAFTKRRTRFSARRLAW